MGQESVGRVVELGERGADGGLGKTGTAGRADGGVLHQWYLSLVLVILSLWPFTLQKECKAAINLKINNLICNFAIVIVLI